MSAHTPGPFVAKREDLTHAVIYNGEGMLVMKMAAHEDAFFRAEHVARTLNAAPQLLEALAELVRFLEPLEFNGGLNVPGLATLNRYRAALALASGEI